MPLPLTANDIFQLNNDILSAFTRMRIGDHLGGIGPNPSGAPSYFVDGNKANDLGDGLSWPNAKNTLSSVITLARAWEAASANRGWAKRQTINIAGDFLTEDLTELPKKTDIVGWGTMNGFPMAGIEGNHSGFAVDAGGCRFFNIHFRAPAAGGDIFTFPTGGFNANTEFYGCNFHASSAVVASGAIIGTNLDFLVVYGCQFTGGFSDAVIELSGTARGLLIELNKIDGDNEGIALAAGATCTPEIGIINKNIIHVATNIVNDASSKFIISNNNGITTQAKGSGHFVGSTFLSSGNKVCASDLANADWPALGTL